MELSHAISDAILAITGLFVFFRYLKRLPTLTCLLWEAFVLSVSLAALAGVFRFLNITPYAVIVSEFFQHLAGTAGGLALVFASFFLVYKKPVPMGFALVVLTLGFVAFGVVRITGNLSVLNAVLMICVPLVFLIGCWGIIKGERLAGMWLILAVVALVVGTYNKNLIPNAPIDSTDIYHYLLAVSLLCFGNSANQHTS